MNSLLGCETHEWPRAPESELNLTPVILALIAAAPKVAAPPRTPAAIVVLAPFGRTRTVSISEVVDAGMRAFEERTDLRMFPPSQSGVDVDRIANCPADRRLSCWLAAAEPRLRYMLLVSLASSPTGDLASMTWIDLGRARTALDAPEAEGGDTATIDWGAVPLDDLPSVFAELIDVRLRETLERDGHFGRPEPLMLTEPATAATTLVPPARAPARSIVEWSGAGTAAVGLGFLAWSLVLATQGPRSTCLAKGDTSRCEHVRLPGSALSGLEGAALADAADGGLPVFALGLGLATAGGAAWLGARSAPDDLWWLPIAIGLVAGGSAFGLSYAIGHR